MKKEIKDPREKMLITVQVTTAGAEDQDGRASNSFKDRRTQEMKLQRNQATRMMNEIEEVVNKYLKVGFLITTKNKIDD